MFRNLRFGLVAGCLPLLLCTQALSLEKAARRLSDRAGERDWTRTNTVSIAYFNNCTGWVWIWTDFAPGERYGTHYNVGSSGTTLNTTWHLVFSPAPSGYGFTGTIGTYSGTGCPSDPMILASQPYIAPADGWHAVAWGIAVPSSFTVQITNGPQENNPLGVASDHPGAGPTGPISCGTCYPTTRTTSSRLFGASNSALCPGQPIFDGFCAAEWMMEVALKPVVSVDAQSWGQVKALYR